MKKQKFKKVRGRNKILRNIEKWKQENLFFDKELLLNYNYLNSKFRVRPWSDLVFTKYPYPEPDGEFREKIIESLVDIYNHWKIELEKLKMDYYLKIWIFYPNFRESQVACGINERIDWYDNLFFENEERLKFPINRFSNKSNLLLNEFDWENLSWEQVFDENEVGTEKEYTTKKDYLEHKKWFEDFLKSEHKAHQFKDENGKNQTYHYLKIDDVWIGEIKNFETIK